MESKVLEELKIEFQDSIPEETPAEKKERIEKKYLSNEQVESTEWELISIYVRYLHGTGGVIETRFAYRSDIEDTFKIKEDGSIVLGKVYPGRITRQIKSKINEHNPHKCKVPKRTTIKRVSKEQPTIMIIKRNK